MRFGATQTPVHTLVPSPFAVRQEASRWDLLEIQDLIRKMGPEMLLQHSQDYIPLRRQKSCKGV